ncbi:metallophosphoesterase [Bifidobacterium criceti]|uniref:metallophosphoesterase n=1 Tax=Bifidobacterium criceti TaxID=1960969 RepID=UPI000BAB9424|nr:metallophosphoesterase [Bifidobacterium criceti]
MSEREVIQQVSEADAPLSISQRLGRLQFHRSGKFRILQLADIQDGPKVSADTIHLIEAALASARPDLVVFSGNQIAGYDPAYAATFCKRHWKKPMSTPRREAELEQTRARVRESIRQFVTPMVNVGVPWAVTYGNHDFQCGLSNAQLDAVYHEFKGCLNPVVTPLIERSMHIGDGADRTQEMGDVCVRTTAPALADEIAYVCEPGTFALPVANDRGETVVGIVLVDSGDYAPTGGYGAPDARALAFLRQLPDALGADAKSIVFQHTALPQYYQLLKPAMATSAHAVEGYRMFSGQYYTLDDAKTAPGGYLGEGISCPDDDSGEFAILRDTHAYFAIATGHDHRNAFDGIVDGVRMIASPTCGFGSYGPVPERRAARLFEFDIRHPYEPRTQLLEFGELVGRPNSKKAYVYGMTAESKPKSEGVNLLHKPNMFSRVFHSIAKNLFGK